MKEFDCHFTFETIVQTHGKSVKGAIENVEEFLNESVIQTLSEKFGCGTDFNHDEFDSEEIYDGWHELNLVWSGYWTMDANDEEHAKQLSEELLDERLTPLYQSLENISTKNRRFAFRDLVNEKTTDILEV